jgi:hypothetical protein
MTSCTGVGCPQELLRGALPEAERTAPECPPTKGPPHDKGLTELHLYLHASYEHLKTTNMTSFTGVGCPEERPGRLGSLPEVEETAP